MAITQSLKKQVPTRAYDLLQNAGRLAERLQVPAYVVGGFVRDLLLHRANVDLDLVIEGDGIAFAQAFAKMVGAEVTAHPRFGTAIVCFSDGFKLDVAMARTERYERPAALPIVEASSIEQDLFRRDFTINALAIRLDGSSFGTLLDPYGGERDLQRGAIRVLHRLSFADDPTRVFRAVRFEQRYDFRIENETLALIKQAVKRKVFRRLSSSRLGEEVVLLLSEGNPQRMIARVNELDLLQFIHPRLRHLESSAKLNVVLKDVADAITWYATAAPTQTLHLWLPYFAALMELIPVMAVRTTVKRLALPRRQADIVLTGRVRGSVILKRLGKAEACPSQISRILSGLPDEALLYLLAKAPRDRIKRQIREYLTKYRATRSFLSGTDLKAMGLQPGPLFTLVLDRLLAARLDGEAKSAADERELVRKLTEKKGLR
jgi:tRNA nucleotidyltransferase (CCA-adding enzyme)